MPEATADTAAPPRSGPGALVVVLATLLAACVAGGSVYIFTGKREAAADAKEPAGEHKAGDKKPKLPALYVKLDPPFVSNFEARGAMRFLQVSVEVMTRDPASADLVKQHDPMIRNDLLMLLGNQTLEAISTPQGKDQLRAAALEAVRKVIVAEGGDGAKIEQLYFTSFVMQ
ncbi:MAG TPA: flagellar basal body-associated FliL family protein [Povalibacter sp.]|nr:flagellar basal body-associated FliL family protein [Povalibacter sp.]